MCCWRTSIYGASVIGPRLVGWLANLLTDYTAKPGAG
jgi:hypothetical protein